MDIEELQEKVIEFRDARDWAQYHNPKDLVISLSFAFARLAAPRSRGDHAVARENEGG